MNGNFKVKFTDGVIFRQMNGKPYYLKNKIYEIKNGVLIDEMGNKSTGIEDFTYLKKHSFIAWELVEEQTLLDKFYDLLGVKDKEEFKLKEVADTNYHIDEEKIYCFSNGYLCCKSKFSKNFETVIGKETLRNLLLGYYKIIKLPPKPIFSDKEKEQLKHIYGLFGECWVARDKTIRLWVFTVRPEKGSDMWDFEDGSEFYYELVETILPFIKWEDTEPFEINQQLIDSFKE